MGEEHESWFNRYRAARMTIVDSLPFDHWCLYVKVTWLFALLADPPVYGVLSVCGVRALCDTQKIVVLAATSTQLVPTYNEVRTTSPDLSVTWNTLLVYILWGTFNFMYNSPWNAFQRLLYIPELSNITHLHYNTHDSSDTNKLCQVMILTLARVCHAKRAFSLLNTLCYLSIAQRLLRDRRVLEQIIARKNGRKRKNWIAHILHIPTISYTQEIGTY